MDDKVTKDADAIVHEAKGLLKDPSRRRLLGNVLSLGGLSLATGVTLNHFGSVDEMLARISKFNDGAQGLLFHEGSRAPNYDVSRAVENFRFNAYYAEELTPQVEADSFRLSLSGKIADKRPWALNDLKALPYTDQVTRLICVEGWSMIGHWGGVTLGDFLKRIGADLTCKYVGFRCADDYYTSIDMPTALHAQTLLVHTWRGGPLPAKYGFPLRLRMPTKLGFKNAKHISEIFVTNIHPGGYWEDKGYNWFSGS